jgi:hypothetical protein
MVSPINNHPGAIDRPANGDMHKSARKALVRLGLFLAALATLVIGYVVYDRRRAAFVNRACQTVVRGDTEEKVRQRAGEPTATRACGADGYYPGGRRADVESRCSKEYWYSTEYLGGGWLVWFDDSGQVIETAHLSSP